MIADKSPGAYIEETNLLRHTVKEAPTGVPVFIGYTGKAEILKKNDLLLIPQKIFSFSDFEKYYGDAYTESGITIEINPNETGGLQTTATIGNTAPYEMYYGLQLYFANGGGPCFIVSCAGYSETKTIDLSSLINGFNTCLQHSEITLIVFPDACHLPDAMNYYDLFKQTLEQIGRLKDRFTILDVYMDSQQTKTNIETLRNADLGNSGNLKYGAAYYPFLISTISYHYRDSIVQLKSETDPVFNGVLSALEQTEPTLYLNAKKAISELLHVQPSCCAVAAIFYKTDKERGIWHSPANTPFELVIKPVLYITHEEQEYLNADGIKGISVNAIRSFPGRGVLIWGARTLAGNDNEWRYIAVRRFCTNIETNIRNSLQQFIFEANESKTWLQVAVMLENYLIRIWREGGLAGIKPEYAFYVHCGLGSTMTGTDLLEGRMITEIGIAPLRPAEFIVLRFSVTMTTS
jgi:phage tail sheath protein FI